MSYVVTLALSEEEVAELRAAAESDGRSIANYVKRAVLSAMTTPASKCNCGLDYCPVMGAQV